MTTSLQIRCRDLGVDHDGFVSGTSLEDFISCIKQQLVELAGMSEEEVSSPRIRDLVRSAVIQSCRPSATRSVKLAELIA